MPFAEASDIDIYYEVSGEGEPLIMIMGLGGDLTRWYRILPYLKREFKVVTFDNRGAGRTEKPDRPYSMEIMANDVFSLMTALEIDKAHIFGISMGGLIAQELAWRHPDKVTSLILGCTRCGGEFGITDGSEAGAALDPEMVKNLSPAQRARQFMPYLYSADFIRANPKLMDEMVALAAETPIDPSAYNRQMQAFQAGDMYERLPEIQAPTLVISGDVDRIIPAENSAILAARIPGAKLVMLEGLGHGFYSEEPEKTAGILTAFLKNNRRLS